MSHSKADMSRGRRKVFVDYIGIPHYYAVCQNCEWTYEDARNRHNSER
jgi:hypothetical protein